MKRRDFLRWASLAGVTLLGGLAQGCGSAWGHESSRRNADLKLNNQSPVSIHVYIDGSHIGDVSADSRGYFHVTSGTRTVEVREHGDSVYYDLGDHYFGWGRVDLTYDG